MRYILWNLRGFGHAGRRLLLKEYILKDIIDVVALQETIKSDFSHRDLLSIDPMQRFSWHWLAAAGHSGGILLGCNKDVLEVTRWERRAFFVAAVVHHRVADATWLIASVYGLADHDRSVDFLGEIHELVIRCDGSGLPVLLGEDFNLIRSRVDKSYDHIDWLRVNCSMTQLRPWH